MALQTRLTQQHFRQTGKFKPITELHNYPETPHNKFAIQSFQRLPPYSYLSVAEGARLFRVYLDEPNSNSTEESIIQIILSAFESLDVSGNVGEGGELFMNVGGVLVEKVREREEKFCISQLDYGCAVVKMTQTGPKCLLDVYAFEGRPLTDREFSEEISIKLRAEPDSFYLVQRGRILSIVKSLVKNYPMLQLTDHNLEQSCADVERQGILIKNLSARIIAVKFQEDNYSKSNEPLLINIANKEVFSQILFKINRIKYHRYKIQEPEIKDWHSFDHHCPKLHKKQTKTTSDKAKIKPNKVSILSTNAVEDSKQSEKKKMTLVNQPRHLKISQRVATNTKESNLVPSQADYAVSVKDEKEKENPYFDQFQNLLYEQEGGQEKQLALNDSFQQFEKKQHSEKNLEIMKELNKRKEKETEQKRLLDSLKQKIKELIAEQKEWINKNFKLKADIKRLKNPETTEQNKEIDQIKIKIAEMKIQERILMEELAEIKKNNCIQALVFCEGKPQESSQSQRGKDKIFHSINHLHLQTNPAAYNPLTASVRSNNGNSKFPTLTPQMSAPQGPPLTHPTAFKQNYRNFPMQSPPPSPLNLYSSIPTQSVIQQGYMPLGQSKPSPILMSSNDLSSFQRQNPHNHQNSMAFTSAIFPSGPRMPMGSPLGAKKASFQAFPTANSNKN